MKEETKQDLADDCICFTGVIVFEVILFLAIGEALTYLGI